MQLDYAHMDTPVGPLLVAGTADGLYDVRFPVHGRAAQPEAGWKASDVFLVEAMCQLEAYFAAERRAFDLSLVPQGTDFQRAVWTALLEIPYGQTWSYGQVAQRIARPGSARAVGAAVGANPLPIVIPCHRVVGANGTLTGFGGGLRAKQWLLDLERLVVQRAQPSVAP